MSYATIEAALLTVIQTHADFSSANSSRGDYRIIGHGKSRCAVIVYGGHTREEFTVRYEKNRWTIYIDLFIPFPGEITSLQANFLAERQKLIDTIAKYPRLNAASGVIRAIMETGAEPDAIGSPNPSFRGQRLTCIVEEIVDPGRAE